MNPSRPRSPSSKPKSGFKQDDRSDNRASRTTTSTYHDTDLVSSVPIPPEEQRPLGEERVLRVAVNAQPAIIHRLGYTFSPEITELAVTDALTVLWIKLISLVFYTVAELFSWLHCVSWYMAATMARRHARQQALKARYALATSACTDAAPVEAWFDQARFLAQLPPADYRWLQEHFGDQGESTARSSTTADRKRLERIRKQLAGLQKPEIR